MLESSVRRTLRQVLTGSVLAAVSLAGRAQTIATEPVSVPPISAPTPVPVDHPLALIALVLGVGITAVWWLRRMGVSMDTVRHLALGGVMLALGASAFWGDAVLAQWQLLQRQFTQAGGETLAIPVQAIDVNGSITGFVPVEFTNATDNTLRIKGTTAPTWNICFPAGTPATAVTTTSPPTGPKCVDGVELQAGKTCWVDVSTLCADAATALQGAAPSVLVADAVSVNEGESVSGNVLANDSDADGPLQVASFAWDGIRHLAGQSASVSGLGDFSLSAAGAFTFQASKPFPSSTLKIAYTTHTGAIGELTITVNRTPKAVDDSPVVTEDVAMSIAVLANDSDPDGDVLDVTAFTQGAHGSVTKESSGNLLYTPASNYFGSDSFSYTISDGKGLTATARVHVTIESANDAPVTSNVSLSTHRDVPVNGSISASDVDGDTLSYVITGAPANGTVVLNNATGSFTYTPSTGFNGSDSFAVTVNDGKGGTAVAAVTIAVTAVNSAPTAANDNATTDENTAVTIAVRANDTDADGDPLTVTGVTQGANGSVVIDAVTGNPIYTPNSGFTGTDVFTYTIDDGRGGTDTGTVAVTVIVTVNANSPPTAVNDTASTVASIPVSIPVANLLSNDTDPDGDTLTIASVENAMDGTVALIGSNVIFTPAPGFDGIASFTYSVSDGKGGTSTATVQVSVGSATTPSLVVSRALVINAHGTGGTSVKFPIITKLVETDGSESLTIKVGNVPTGVSFNAGTNLGGGFWQFTEADLSNLTLNVPGSYTTNATHLTVQVTAKEISSGATASISNVVTVKASYTTVDITTTESGGYSGSSANEYFQGGAGNNTIDAGHGNNIVSGGAGNDILSAGVGSDVIYGGSGDDIINGGSGSDVIIGGSGNDTLKGGDAGENFVDIFVWALGDQGAAGAPAMDTILNFATSAASSNLAGGDVLNLRDLLQGESVGPLNGAGNLADYLHFEVSSGSTIIHISHTGGFSADSHSVSSAYTGNAETQRIVLSGVNLQSLYSSAATDQQIITQLLNHQKLIVD